MQYLGYEQIEVRVMKVNDYAHQLQLEITENESRKDFTPQERVYYTEKLIELKRLNGANLHQAEEEAAKESGIGSRRQFNKEKSIVQKADDETLEAWNKEEISTNKAYERIKELERQVEELKNQEPKIIEKIIEKEIVPDDYDKLKREVINKQYAIEKLEIEKKSLEQKTELNKKNAERYAELKGQIESLTKQKNDLGRWLNSTTELSGLTVEVKNFFNSKFAPIKYSKAITEASQDETVKRNLKDILNIFQDWINEMNRYVADDEIEIIEAEVME